VVPAVRRAIGEVNPRLPIGNVQTLADQVDASITVPQLVAELSAFFGLLAVFLACIGIYGLASYAVSRRTNEIGIRMALGAEKRDVLRMVIGQGLKLALIGVAIGVACALPLTRFLSSLLYGVKPTDPLTFIAVSLILIAVALVACYRPRSPRRQSRSHGGAEIRIAARLSHHIWNWRRKAAATLAGGIRPIRW